MRLGSTHAVVLSSVVSLALVSMGFASHLAHDPSGSVRGKPKPIVLSIIIAIAFSPELKPTQNLQSPLNSRQNLLFSPPKPCIQYYDLQRQLKLLNRGLRFIIAGRAILKC